MSYYRTNSARLSLLGHFSFGVKSMAKAEPFYNAVFEPFGIVQVYRDAKSGEPARAAPHGLRTHLAFNAPSREAVDKSYTAALANDGKGDGEPGLRKKVGPNYYKCSVYDPDGHRLEAVFQQPIEQE